MYEVDADLILVAIIFVEHSQSLQYRLEDKGILILVHDSVNNQPIDSSSQVQNANSERISRYFSEIVIALEASKSIKVKPDDSDSIDDIKLSKFT